jgi:biofilm PGA synthesis lipoprotein PgaB
VHVVQADLDYVYDTDPEQETRNLDALIASVRSTGANVVFLQAFANPQGNGLASELYFPNHKLPMRADLFAEAVTRLKNEAGVQVYGWLPVLSFDLEGLTPVLAWDGADNVARRDDKAYRRLSPFDASTRKAITAIYQDMARAAPIDGVLFHDDALLSDYEDFSAPALAAYKKAGLPATADALRSADVIGRWAEFKTETLIGFTEHIAKAMRKVRPSLMTARNIYAQPVLDPQSRTWFAQDYARFLKAYDYTAIEAMPQMENIPGDEAEEWLGHLADAAGTQPDAMARTIFELQAVDWRKSADDEERAIPADRLAEEIQMLAAHGAVNFGYYPDDFIADLPQADRLHAAFSPQPVGQP